MTPEVFVHDVLSGVLEEEKKGALWRLN